MEIAGIPAIYWGGFLAFVLAMLALDLGVFHRKAHEVRPREALIWTGVWIGLALIFNLGIYLFWPTINPASAYTREEASLAFFTGFLLEKALSVDNIFVFLVIFSYFSVPKQLQHRVLFWGIIGALASRAIFIAVGGAMLEHYSWTMILLGGLLLVTGVKLAMHSGSNMDPSESPALRALRRFLRVTPDYVGSKFLVRIDGKLWATPLLAALLVVEFTDVLFALDSIPAIFAITREPFIVATSNVFAILGLRSLFFAVSGLMGMFRYLNYGLAAVLVYVGGKMLYGYAEKSVFPDWPKLPVLWSLAVVATCLGVAVVASIVAEKRSRPCLDPVE